MDAHAARQRGWSISTVARQLATTDERSRTDSSGERTAGVRAPFDPVAIEPLRAPRRQRAASAA